MLKLDLKTEPYWLDLPCKVRVRVTPVNTAIMAAAQADAVTEYNVLPEKPESETRRKGISESLLIKALARLAILEWEGVLEAEGDTLAPLNDNSINMLMDIWLIADEFLKLYVSQIRLLETEGNVSAPAAAGTMAVAVATASNAS